MRARWRGENFAVVKAVVVASDMISGAMHAFVASDLASGELAEVPLKLPWFPGGLGIAHLRGRTLSPPAEAFVARVIEVDEELSGQDEI